MVHPDFLVVADCAELMPNLRCFSQFFNEMSILKWSAISAVPVDVAHA